MQSIAVAFGASLKEIPNHQQIGVEYAHPVTINTQSKLYKILGSETIIVNSRHKEAITNPSIIKVVGYSDNVIEAVEKDDNSFMIGVQWHPEDMLRYDKSSQKLFKYFFTCCKSYSRKKNKCDII
jgi:putative glutamine amidotransferase